MVSGLPILANPILANPFLANPFLCVLLWLVLVWVSVLCCSFLLVCCVFVCCSVLLCVCVLGVFKASLPDPLRRTAQNFALFFSSSRHSFILFSLSCWSFSLNFGGVFEDRDPQRCTFGLSGCRVKTPAAPPDRAAGARTRQPENSKRAHLSAPALHTPPKFHEKDQKRGRKE